MIHHPIVLGTKLILLLIILLALLILNGILPPDQFRLALIVGAIAFVVGVVALWIIASKVLANPNSRLGRQMILSQQAGAQGGRVAFSDEFESMVGAFGVAVSHLKPAGIAVFGEKRVSVVTEGGFIEKGSEVQITSVQGSRVVVRLASPPEKVPEGEG